jgi:uncharacterized protein (TIGR02145 family)
LGKKAEVDYVARCNVVSRDHILRMDCELYSSQTGALIGPFNSFKENPTTIYELITIVEKEAPDMFRKIPGVSRSGIGTPSFAAGISGLETAAGSALDFETRYLVNLSTVPSNAALSFNGVPIASCAQSPCRAELPEGRIRIIAALEQYETADTTVSITRNNQNVNIRLKANFGVLEIKPAYSDGMGSNERWNLTINDKAFSSLENRLSPNKYKVKLSHRCYEDISFDVGINRDKREVFDISKHINPKQGGLVLSTERDGEPSSESVFVNGKRVGETPFSGSVPVCSEIELGREKTNVYVRLEHGQTVRRTHKMPDSQEWLDKIAEEQRRAAETAEERRRRKVMERGQKGSFTDPRDGKEYKTVKIGEQIWMAQNLNFNTNGSSCYGFFNKDSNCQKYGRLYDWNTARKACPNGWRLPSDADWTALESTVGGETTAGTKLKSLSGWNRNGNGTDDFDFAALPGGYGFSGGSFNDVGNNGRWWSSTTTITREGINVIYRGMVHNHSSLNKYNIRQGALLSVRCVKN